MILSYCLYSKKDAPKQYFRAEKIDFAKIPSKLNAFCTKYFDCLRSNGG